MAKTAHGSSNSMDEERVWTVIIMGKAIEVLIKLLGNDKLWELIGKIIDLLQKRGVVKDSDTVEVAVRPKGSENHVKIK